ncbi:urease accessory protein UreH domain-containing protein [Ectobacillus funiculus]|uniref:Sulfite exporter TauE/SafE family protein n=1 Tax=Ectobacillus funiculus TaxID=137993 RepID=A0ABV5WEI2_9BACI
MFTTISQWSYQLMAPIMDIANATRSTPIVFAMLLGVVGTLAPCQLTGNISAMTLYGNRSLQKRVPWTYVWLFVLGKIVAFTFLGLLVWILGREIQQELPVYFPWLRKFMGPLLIVSGLLLTGVIRVRWSFSMFGSSEHVSKQGKVGAFLMGFLFSLAFCPTMFVLFFGTLMPFALSSAYGYAFPSLFAIGTALPVIILTLIISYLGLSGALLKKSRKIGRNVQITAGLFMILIGIYDSFLYWM